MTPTPTISVLVLFLLMLCAFSFMMLKRLRIVRATSPVQSLEAFDETVAAAIRDAGSDERHHREMNCDLRLADLRKIRHNFRFLMEEAGELREKTWAQVAHALAEESVLPAESVSEIADLHRSLLHVNSSCAKAMLFSAIEIIIGKIVHHSHYHYTYLVEAEYCVASDIVETMADVVDQPTAVLLRTHLS